MNISVRFIWMLFICFVSWQTFACSYYNFVTLTFQHSRRIPHNYVSVEMLEKEDNKIEVHTVSKKLNEEKKRTHSVQLDTVFLFRHDHYESICHNIEQLDIKVLREIEKEDGLDGTMCTLSFGYEDEVQTFNIWSPNDSTNQRGLFLFKLCCEQILRAGGLKPEEIF
jgi:hypothetical protein